MAWKSLTSGLGSLPDMGDIFGGGNNQGPPIENPEGGGGAGRGGGRRGSQPTITEPTSWVGKGKGRAGSQPTIADANVHGHRRGYLAPGQQGPTLPESQILDPEGNYVFALEIDGIEVATFMECSGLKSTTTVFELEEGGRNDMVHKLPGQSRWENLTLRYGVTSNIDLLEWRDAILQDNFGGKSRRSGAIVLKRNNMEVVRRYNFQSAWPVSWEGPSFSASSPEVAVEMVELAHHGLYVE